jgi:hypothetical protein
MSANLVETIAIAAVAAIRGQERAITTGAGVLHAITLTLEIANNGDVIDSRCTIEWRGVHRSKGASRCSRES